MPLLLTWLGTTSLPVECDGLTPDHLASLGAGDVARLPVRVGRETEELGSLFRVSGHAEGCEIVFEGDLQRVRGLGAGMIGGTMRVLGDVGPMLGVGMMGGLIDVRGSVGVWAGAEMRGGLLRITGAAGDHLAAALPGSRLGMRGGAVLVHGGAGSNVGLAMRRGLIAISGAVGDDLGHGMIAGTIAAFGAVGRRAGVGMKRGTLWLGCPSPVELPPGFRFACLQRPTFLALYQGWLADHAFAAPTDVRVPWRRYNGDVIGGGQGEVFVPE
jgi:formylmethanofuran dehydrogenase subunit C